MARDGMATLIGFVRNEAQVGTADYTISGVAYWTDDQIEDRLDRYRTEHRFVPLTSVPTYTDGTYAYQTYVWPQAYEFVEDGGTAGTTNTDAGWRVYSSDGSAAPAYTPNYDARQVVFTNDTDGTAYYADFRTYDVYAAIADIWGIKASSVSATAVEWATDNHRVKNTDLIKNYRDMERYYRGMAGGGGIQSAQMVRNDLPGWVSW